MKGTLFSTDYVLDSNGNPRLVELNTDTGAISKTFGTHLHVDGFINMLSSSNIDTVAFVYKGFQQNMVDWINDQLTVSASFITTIDQIEEAENTIYPTAVPDTSNKFILRMAYDENAILDSTYAKHKTNLHKLFTDYTSSMDTVEYYYSGSDGIYDTVNTSSLLNSHSEAEFLPDFVIKTKSEVQQDVIFSKVGLSTSSSIDRYNKFKDTIDTTNEYFEKFHFEDIDISGSADRKLQSIRSFDIIYDTSLTLMNLGRYCIECYFDIPTSASLHSEGFYDDNTTRNDYNEYHKHEFSTKFVKSGQGLQKNEILIGTGSNNFIVAENITVSSSIQSFYISGSDLSDLDYSFIKTEFTGQQMISGSYVTSSLVEDIITSSKEKSTISEIVLSDGTNIYSGMSKHFFTYNTGSNVSRYVMAIDIDPDIHFIHTYDGNIAEVSQSNMVILKQPETLYSFDVENVDTMLLSGSKSIVHNAPCFVEGTMIHTDQGKVSIENILPGDNVITWNHESEEAEMCQVLNTMIKEDEHTVTYVFDNGTELQGTPDHPLYVIGKGYSSYYPKQTLDDSGMSVEQILIGDSVKHLDGYGVKIIDIVENEKTSTVYNLDSVEKNHNFFAEDLLVHNRAFLESPTCFAAGTEISLSNGDVKSIEDIVEGDEVLGWDGESIQSSVVTAIDHRHTVGSHADACKSLGDEPSLYTINDTKIEFTPEHPFLTKEGWKSLVPDPNQKPYNSEQEPKVLKVGDEINKDGEWVEIEDIRIIRSDAEESVYNITVDKLHSYIANGIIVHNK